MEDKKVIESIEFYNFKSQLIDYVTKRISELNDQQATTEYDYCEVQGQIKELENLLNFSKKLSVSKS